MPDQLRIASYNVHKAVGVDYRRSPERIARVIASLKADIVALQEVDRRLASPACGAVGCVNPARKRAGAGGGGHQ